MEKNFTKITIQIPNQLFKKQGFLKTVVEMLKYDFSELKNLEFENVIWERINASFQGVFIKELNYFVYFSQELDHKTLKPKSRNTFIKQNVRPFIQYFEKSFINEAKIQLFISLNPLSLDLLQYKQTRFKLTSSIYIDLQILKKLYGFRVTKSFVDFTDIDKKDEEKWSNLDLETFISIKKEISEKYPQNKPIIFEFNKEREEIIVYGKLEGALISDALFTCKMIRKLNQENHKHFKLFFVDLSLKENKNSLKLFEKIGFAIIEKDKNTKHFSNKTHNTKETHYRNQRLFKINITTKYNQYIDIYECFACDYRFNLVAAHIHRVTDINKLKNDRDLITSAENGFQFCPNHDKEFENGMIYFDLDEFKFKVNSNKVINEEDYKLLNQRIKNKLTKWDDTLFLRKFLSVLINYNLKWMFP